MDGDFVARIIVLLIGIIIAGCFAFDVICWFKASKEMNKQTEKQQEMLAEIQRLKRPEFSLQSYFDRIEKLNLELLQEYESRDRPELVLWWGLDGIRLNEDGSSEWISKRPKKHESPEYYPLDYNALANTIQIGTLNCNTVRYYSCLQASPAESTKMQMERLQGNISTLNLQLKQNASWNQAILSQIQSMKEL